jgi:hypothetical protein
MKKTFKRSDFRKYLKFEEIFLAILLEKLFSREENEHQMIQKSILPTFIL